MKNLNEDQYLRWLSFLQCKGISNSNLNDLISLNKLNFSFFKNEIVDSFKAPIIQNKIHNKFEVSSKFLHIYKIPKFISKTDCTKVIEVINKSKLIRTGKGLKLNAYTDKKCQIDNHEIIQRINEKMFLLIGDNKSLPTLGMKYFKNDFKAKHFDNPWISSNGNPKLGLDSLKNKAVTSWTFMIYLNEIADGGETFFPKINLKITPKAGTALIWNNLFVDGSINPYSEHQSLYVKKDEKYIITKWFKASLS